MPCYFVYDNLKANPFALYDEPLPGFEVLSWNSWTTGTMWDIGNDAGFTTIGHHQVYGQVWKLVDPSQNVLHKIRDYSGAYTGLREEVDVRVVVPIDDLIKEELQATTFALSKIANDYEIIREGRWRF